MLSLLVKKQFMELFKSYFYDAKKNRMRPKWAIALWFVFYILIVVGMLGGIFTALALSMCEVLHGAGLDWLYFLLFALIAIVLGAFGSVVNTFSALYLAKDNDLLLSLPIPVQTIMAARLLNVYLMGTIYAAVVFVPALIVSWVIVSMTVSRIVCGILLLFIVTLIVMLLSCILGWAVARISLKLKNRSFVTVLASLAFISAYYYLYFNANSMISKMVENAVLYGEKIKGTAYLLYLFGHIGEGDWATSALFLFVFAALAMLVWVILQRSFLTIAAGGETVSKVRYVEKPIRQKSVFGALLSKEFARFTSSSVYMLNCGLGILLIPLAGVMLVWKGPMIIEVLDAVFLSIPDTPAILICTMLGIASSMIDITAPSVSLEGRNLWIPQSLPVSPKLVLRAKLSVQLILSGIVTLFASVCGAAITPSSLTVKILMVLFLLSYTGLSAVFGMVIGVRMPVLTWTNETGPIKQSATVTIVIFVSWIVTVLFAGLYMLAAYRIGAAMYLILWIMIHLVITFLMLKWLDTKGSRIFASL